MAKTKTSSAAKQRYNEKAYDRISVTVPKGVKAVIEMHAKTRYNLSVNGLINELLRIDMGLSKYQWTGREQMKSEDEDEE